MSVMRSAPEMASFLIYCEQNPELRFWQALLAWTTRFYNLGDIPYAIMVALDDHDMDTNYWEWEGEHPIGPTRHV